MGDWRAAEAALSAASKPETFQNEMTFSLFHSETERFVEFMFFGGQQRVFAEGPLDQNAAERFQIFVRENGIDWARVYFNSPGGSLQAGLKLGRLIRTLGFDTEIGKRGQEYGDPPNAICASAAAYAFAGGVHRFYREAAGYLGVHQFHDGKANHGDLGVAQRASGEIVAYLQEMDVDAAVFSLAASTSSSDMIWLTEAEATRLRFSNNGIAQTTAEIKIREGQTYLKLQQIHHNVTARVLVFPGPTGFALSCGIVTTRDVTASKMLDIARNYIELDWEEMLALDTNEGVCGEDCVIWLMRALSRDDMQKLLQAETMGIWLENGGPMRWGAMMDIAPVRSAIVAFLEGCAVTAA